MDHDTPRVREITRYLQEEQNRTGAVTGWTPAGGQHVHIHHHYPAEPVAPAAVPDRPDVMAKYAPYFMLALGGMIIVAGIGVIVVFVLQALMGIMIAFATMAGSLAVVAVAVAVAARSLRSSKVDADLMAQRIEATRPRKGRK